MKEHAGWRSLEAVRMGRVLRIDERLQYPSPVAFDALEEFARQLRAAEVR
jgi:ABC-type Fe3+-hydroxamate transport system substrate-binding protein